MSRLFNTSHDRISAEDMFRFAKVFTRKRNPSAKEQMATVPAIRAYRNGASAARAKQIWQAELNNILT